MKLTVMLCLVFQISVLAKAQNVSLHLKGRPLSEVLGQIARQADISFTYGQSVAEISKPVSITVDNIHYLEAIRICLKGQPLSFRVLDDKNVWIFSTVGIEEKKGVAINDTIGEMEFVGKVMDEKGVPLAGASVRILSLARGTQTDASGKFRIKGDSKNSELSISYTGFKTQFINGSIKEVMVYLAQAVTKLDAAVVQGYGITTQRFTTGNIATITAEDIKKQPVQNVLQAVQGRIAGLTITQTNGNASSPVKVEVRGRMSLNSNITSDPLYVVDGVPWNTLDGADGSGGGYESGSSGLVQNGFPTPAGGYSPLYSIDPNDIESITVLKDGDATAIYGSRGGRGVILINTKKGKTGQGEMEASAVQGVSFVNSEYDMLSLSEYIGMRYEAFKNSQIAPDAANAYDLLVWDTTRYTNWQKEYWGKMATRGEYKITFSGGDKQNNYRISGGYNRLSALNTFSGYDERATVSFNMGHRSLNNKLSIVFTGFYSSTRNRNRTLGGSTLAPPNAPPIFKENGMLNYDGWEPVRDQFTFGSLLQPYEGKNRSVNANFKLSYNVLKGLKLGVSMGYSYYNLIQNIRIPISSQDPLLNPLGSAYFGNNGGVRVIVEPTIEYQRQVWKGLIEAVIGGSYQKTSQEGNVVTGAGYTNDALLGTIANAPSKTATDNTGQYKYAASFFRINYNLLDKYIVTFSGRRDGSSRFGPGKQFGNFGAFGAAWIISEEDIIKDKISWISFAKLRASYGVTGSDNVRDYSYLTRWTSNNLRYLNDAAYYPVGHENPNLQWQQDKKLEIAMTLGLFKDRITINCSWYRNRSDDQLVAIVLPSATGFTSVAGNFPATVQNMGWEPTINISLVKTNKIELTFNGVLGINRNKLLSFPGIERTAYANVFQVGRTLNLRKLLVLKGVDPATGKYMFEDVIKDGQISTSTGANDDRVFKDITMNYDGGFGLDLRYKSWQFSSYFVVRNQIGANALYINQPPGAIGNVPRELLNRWQKPGDVSKYARFTVTPDVSDNNFALSDGKYTNASYVRLSNLNLSYNVDKKLLSKVRVKELRIFARGQNLLLFTSYSGSDPETQSFGTLPPLTSIDGGIQITF